MANFSKHSLKELATCDERLQRVFKKVIEIHDCTIMEGHRNEANQTLAFANGNSKMPWPKGKHNKLPSKAVDAAPFPLDWKNRERFVYFAGLVIGIAHEMGIKIRWGGDWDMDNDLKDQNFMDLVHFEVVG